MRRAWVCAVIPSLSTGRVYQRDVVSEFGPKPGPWCRDSVSLGEKSGTRRVDGVEGSTTHWLIATQAREAGELNMLNKGAGDFPDQIYDFHANYGRPLKALRFVAHGLDRFPERAGQELTQLTQLTLASNRLTELPDSICDLAKLSALNLLRNQLTELPDRLGDLSHLRHLDIATNRLQTLPLTFGNLTRLERVVADCNDLRRIPETLSRMTCHTLSFNHNKLVALPRCLANMINLTALSANDNNISFLPSNFGDSRSLTTVKLCANIIEELPESISRLPRLKSLWLDHNAPMAALPWNFYMLTSLVELRMDANPGMKYPTPDTRDLGVLRCCGAFNTIRVHVTMPGVVSFSTLRLRAGCCRARKP